MKKLLIAALLVILGLFLIKRAPWNYEITVNGHNAPMTIKVTMVNGKFKSIEVPRESETIGVGKKALEILTKRIVEEQSLAVDAVSGATVTSYALLGGVEAALQNSKVSTDRFKTKKEAAPAEQEQLTADVIVVGGGGAGLAAAISAEQNGADVLVLERLDFLGGSTNVSEGALNAVDPRRQKPDLR